mmetsp:Transcript_10184/g.11433  ORF Transcript_10184/g.11433 Transcript_10184/m.11433 type:complete len:99 (-) Transcript_10184:31-327(-)
MNADLMTTLNTKINQMKMMSNHIEGELVQDRDILGQIENQISMTQSERNRVKMSLDSKLYAIQNLEALVMQAENAYNKMLQSINTLEVSLDQALNEMN